MRLLVIPALVLAPYFNAVAYASGALDPVSANTGINNMKRWYSVDERVGTSLPAPYRFAWPVKCSAPKVVQPIRYCFKDSRSASNLNEIVQAAIRIWVPAMAVTSMTMIPDPQCTNQDACVCFDDGAEIDALVISDETKDGDNEWNQSEECATSTTVGYDYIPRGEPDRPWRHYLQFCEWDPNDKQKTKPLAERGMAHELGHTIGLLHEHQRADRDDHLNFEPRRLQGYKYLQELVEEDPEKLFDRGLSTRQRLWQVFDRGSIAMYYFPIMIEFLKGNQFAGTPDEHFSASYKSSVEFDFDSIMIYDSWMGGYGSADEPGLFVMTRKSDGSPVWTGGSKDGVGAKITEGDVARVAQLYDARTPECEEAKKGTKNWEANGIKVKMRDGPWFTVPPPNKSDFTRQ